MLISDFFPSRIRCLHEGLNEGEHHRKVNQQLEQLEIEINN